MARTNRANQKRSEHQRAQQRRRRKQAPPARTDEGRRAAAPHEASAHHHGREQGPLSPEQRQHLAARAQELLLVGVEAALRDDRRAVDEALAHLLALSPHPAELRVVQLTLVRLLRGQIRRAWERGWQPIDVYEWVRRRSDVLTAQLAASAMADELTTYASASVAPDWHEQLSAIGAAPWWPPSQTWAGAHAEKPESAWPLVLESSLSLFAVLVRLVPLQQFLPLPGQAHGRRTPVAHVDQKVLQRVRQMLAQAESTSFDGEAQTFTAAAQRLMARHSIDAAILASSSHTPGADRPTGRRIWIERPYVTEKVLLLNEVAGANRVRAVWFRELELVTLLGHGSDLEAVETLYTSLLVQATRAMQAEGGRVTDAGTSRTRSFRRSFLTAYSARIGERLAEATADETRSAAADLERSAGQAVLPVLQAREEAVDAYAAEVFPHLVASRVSSGSDWEGWSRGRSAADRAHLTTGAALPQ